MHVSTLLLIVGFGAFLLLLAAARLSQALDTEDDRWPN